MPEVTPRALCSLFAAGRARRELRPDRALGAAAHFQADERGDRQRQKHQEEEQEHRVHGENGGGQHGAEGQQGQEKIVARGAGAVEAHDHGVEQQVNRRQQRRVQRRILRVGGEIPGDPPQVRGKPEKVDDHQEGGRAVADLRAPAPPPAVAFEEQRRRGETDANQVELSGGDQRQHADQKQQKQRNLEIAPQGGVGNRGFARYGGGRALDRRRGGHGCGPV